MSLGQITVLFSRLLHSINPIPSEVARAKGQLGGIRARLLKSFNIVRTIPIGSHAKGTAIKMYSDLDILIVIRKSDLAWGGGLISSETLLSKIRDELRERYPLTDARRDRQAVVVNFGGGAHAVDVVPAFFYSPAKTGHPVYLIPDGDGEWMPSSPDAQLKRLRVADARLGNKLRRLIQLIKWWKYSREPLIPINMMHVEAFLVSAELKTIASYSRLLTDTFVMLTGRRGRAIRDPLHISGPIPIAKTETQREKVMSSLNYAVDHAINAFEAEDDGNLIEAIRQWGIVYNGTIPSIR